MKMPSEFKPRPTDMKTFVSGAIVWFKQPKNGTYMAGSIVGGGTTMKIWEPSQHPFVAWKVSLDNIVGISNFRAPMNRMAKGALTPVGIEWFKERWVNDATKLDFIPWLTKKLKVGQEISVEIPYTDKTVRGFSGTIVKLTKDNFTIQPLDETRKPEEFPIRLVVEIKEGKPAKPVAPTKQEKPVKPAPAPVKPATKKAVKWKAGKSVRAAHPKTGRMRTGTIYRIKDDGQKAIVEWADGTRSTLPLTKLQ